MIFCIVGISDKARRVTDDTTRIEAEVQRTKDKVDDIKSRIDRHLWPKYREIRDFSIDSYVDDGRNSRK